MMITINIDNINYYLAKYIKRYIAGGVAGGLVFLLSSCVSIPSGLLPRDGTCVAYGGTLTLKNGAVNPSVGCIETKPYPGVHDPLDFRHEM
jgi:hypothetical protein